MTKPNSDETVLALPGQGRFVWNHVLSDVRFIPYGTSRENGRWFLNSRTNTRDGAVRKAARMLLQMTPIPRVVDLDPSDYGEYSWPTEQEDT